MNTEVAQIALMYVMPLGIAFTTILLAVSADYRYQKISGIIFSLLIVAMDCMFFFTKNTFLTYTNDGALLLSFASMVFLSIVCVLRNEDKPTRAGFIFLAIFMFAGVLGISYWERPTLVIASPFSPSEIAAQNAQYQDYIQSFENGEAGKVRYQKTKGTTIDNLPSGMITGKPAGSDAAAKGRLQAYMKETDKVIDRINEIIQTIDDYDLISPNISDEERETRSRQALAISNNATAINRKALGLFHPHESSEVHVVLIQATECLRLAAYALYTYSTHENPDEQQAEYTKARTQVRQTQANVDRFRVGIMNLLTNHEPDPPQDQQN